jgi:hypothetical protein
MVCKTNPSVGGIKFKVTKQSSWLDTVFGQEPAAEDDTAKSYRRGRTQGPSTYHYSDVETGRIHGYVQAHNKTEAGKMIAKEVRRIYPTKFFNPAATAVKVKLEKIPGKPRYHYETIGGDISGDIGARSKQEALSKLTDDMSMMFGRYD